MLKNDKIEIYLDGKTIVDEARPQLEFCNSGTRGTDTPERDTA